MAFYLSPGVFVKEKDISEIVPTIATTSAAVVGYAVKGSIDDFVLVTNTQQFIDEFGEPDPTLGYFHYSALAYLENGNTLYCQRVVNGALYGGVAISDVGNTNLSFVEGRSAKTYLADSNYPDALFYITGKDPGVWDNKIGIRITNIDDTNKEFDIEVYFQNADGDYELVERWTVSRQTKLDGYGSQLYMETKINGFSSYISVADNTGVADTVMPEPQATTLAVASGSNGNAVGSSEVITGWDSFANPDNVDIRIMINAGYVDVAVQNAMKIIAEDRKDCIALLDIPSDQLSSVTSMVNWREVTQNFNSTYTALYAPWVRIFDSYTDKTLNIPPSGYVASQIAFNDAVANPWNAPAGFNRGLLNVIGVTNVFTQGERDTLYPAQINPIQNFRGEGIAIWGQKMQQVRASATDRMNVRRLLIILEKSIAISLRTFCFENNDTVTRFRIRSVIEQYMNTLSSGGAFQTELGDKGYRVVCDETNNTPAVIDRNELHVDIFIKPAKTAEFIQLQVIITSTSASFEELIAKGVNL
jgi:phage tail sheath protein FI